MWGEYLDEFSIEVKIFPRLNAAAERLWSNPQTDFKTVETRFYRQRERLITKGINADATQPEYCTLFEGECR
jgi:hexosaminidase